MRILVVEDDRALADNLAFLLKKNGYSVDIANTYEDGYEKAFLVNYDLYLLDWMLPDGNGVELCREIRKEGLNTPIMILTAKSQVADRVEGLDSGADDYLAKPFAIEELLARIRSLLRRREEVIPTTLEVGDLKIDIDNKLVLVNGKSVALTLKEFAILELLARNFGKAVSREEILEKVWNEYSEPASNSVEVQINYLRRKIGKERVKTVKGVGYSL